METTKKAKKTFTGVVEKISGQKSARVRIERKFPHKKYGKIVKEHRSFLVHVGEKLENEIKVGDVVIISETKPISKNKSWELVELVK